jgi:fumarate hydratase subunit beta
VRELIAVEWRDLVPHYRLVKLRVQALGPATVGIDAHGNSLYDTLAQDAAQRLPDIMDGLATARRRAAGAAGIDQA